MLEKLMPEQEALIPVVRDEWITRCDAGAPIDRKAARVGIEWLYELCGLKKPEILFFDSPLALQFAANVLHVRANVGGNVWGNVGENVWEKVRENVREDVWANVRANVGGNVWENVWENVRENVGENVGGNVWENVWENVGENVWENVRENVREDVWANVWENVGENVRENVRENVWGNVRENVRENVRNLTFYEFELEGGLWSYDWVAFYDFFVQIGLLKNEKITSFLNLLKSGCGFMLQFERLLLTCPSPRVVRNKEMQIHSTISPALEFADGYKLYALSGRIFPFDLWEKITKHTITKKELVAIDNMELRMAALKELGTEFLLEDAKLLDSSALGNELFLVPNVFDVPAYYLRYRCPSTGRVYVSGVPPEVGIDGKADQAMAWKFGLNIQEYQSIEIQS